jgi:pyrroloquinoline quinone biosynthesis protein D
VRRDAADGRTLVVLPERAVRVSGSGDEILALCDGARSREAIARELAARHGQVERLPQDVHDFLEQMERLGVLESAP